MFFKNVGSCSSLESFDSCYPDTKFRSNVLKHKRRFGEGPHVSASAPEPSTRVRNSEVAVPVCNVCRNLCPYVCAHGHVRLASFGLGGAIASNTDVGGKDDMVVEEENNAMARTSAKDGDARS